MGRNALMLAAVLLIGKANGEMLPRLVVGKTSYTNVTVVSVTATDIYFSHSRGMGNVRLSELEPTLQQRFHFDPEKAAAQVACQRQNNALYFQSLTNVTRVETNSEPVFPNLVAAVEASPPVVEYQYYSLACPKPPQIAPKMLGAAQYAFNCEPQFTWHPIPQKTEHGFNWRIAEVKIALSLPITITLPEGATAPLKAHEEGHRKISEHFYAKCPDLAQRIAEIFRERDFYSSESELSSAEELLTRQARVLIQSFYYSQTTPLCVRAYEYYDILTDHGRNGMDSTEAVAATIARYEPEFPLGTRYGTSYPKTVLSAEGKAKDTELQTR